MPGKYGIGLGIHSLPPQDPQSNLRRPCDLCPHLAPLGDRLYIGHLDQGLAFDAPLTPPILGDFETPVSPGFGELGGQRRPLDLHREMSIAIARTVRIFPLTLEPWLFAMARP